MKLTNPSDRELDAAFAEHVAGWRRGDVERGQRKTKSHYLYAPGYDANRYNACDYAVIWKDGMIGGTLPKWSQSADAVLPWMGKYSVTVQKVAEEEWDIGVEPEDEETRTQYFADKSFPRACVIALLRANGVEIDFTP